MSNITTVKVTFKWKDASEQVDNLPAVGTTHEMKWTALQSKHNGSAERFNIQENVHLDLRNPHGFYTYDYLMIKPRRGGGVLVLENNDQRRLHYFKTPGHPPGVVYSTYHSSQQSLYISDFHL